MFSSLYFLFLFLSLPFFIGKKELREKDARLGLRTCTRILKIPAYEASQGNFLQTCHVSMLASHSMLGGLFCCFVFNLFLF